MVGTAQNVVTEMRYGPGSLLQELVALNPATGPQVTRYEHGVTLGESAVASNRLLRAEIYPDAADSADRISYAWNRQGQRTRMTDQNGTVHEYEYDLLGRPTADKVPALGSGVDAAVQRIDTAYEVRGMMKKVTSYSDPNALSAVNEVSNDYNSFTQLSAQYQVHDGSLSSGSAQVVQYEYESGATNTIRPTFVYYPSSQYVNYRYDDEASNKLSRVEALQLNGQEVCRYSYLGLSTFVTTQYPEPQIEYNFATGSGADRYAGLDRFGRVINALWQYTGDSGSSSSGSGPAALVDLQYGYDRASNRTHRKDLVARSYDQGYDELYEYDGLNRLQKFHRGRLTDDNQTIEAPKLQQGWVLDATGNWQNFTQNDQVDPSQTLDQQRISNRVNEITQIARTVGQQWLAPQYSRTGNMAVIPKTEEPTAGMAALYDAWNRLMQLDNPSSNCTYDGLNRRITKAAAAEERHYYYSTAWQILEERREGSASGSSSSSSGPSSSLDRLYVWGLRYIDDLILREWQLESSPQRHYALQDANWNVTALTDDNGAIVERYSYTAYGVPSFLNPDFTPAANSEAYDWDLLYAGYKWDSESALYQVRYRYLQPAIGTWVSRDPITYLGGDVNLVRYASNESIVKIDPSGLQQLAPNITFTKLGAFRWILDNNRRRDAWRVTTYVVGFSYGWDFPFCKEIFHKEDYLETSYFIKEQELNSKIDSTARNTAISAANKDLERAEELRSSGQNDIITGGIVTVIGGVFTIFSYATPFGKLTYSLSSLVFGIPTATAGISIMLRGKDLLNQASDLQRTAQAAINAAPAAIFSNVYLDTGRTGLSDWYTTAMIRAYKQYGRIVNPFYCLCKSDNDIPPGGLPNGTTINKRPTLYGIEDLPETFKPRVIN